jgi:aldehyde dehydrogenase (NAD+)
MLGFLKAASALLAGNTVVLKPSAFTPLTALKVGEIDRDILPAGALNVISGGDDLGPWLTSHPGDRQDQLHGVDPDRAQGDGERA